MYILSEENIELIHRIFGGEVILEDQIESVNTGGDVMNDLYPTANGHLVVVFQYGAIFVPSRELYEHDCFTDFVYDIESNDVRNEGCRYPLFHFDEPLEWKDV